MTGQTRFIHLSPPHMGDCELPFVEEAFASNWIAPLGPHVDAFERETAELVGAAGAVALCSGTAAIHMALRLAGVGPGDTVFCSTLTFVASANPIVYLGASPVFIDSEPASWNLSPQALERALDDARRNGRLPKALVAVHLYGQSADMDPIMSLCGEYGVAVVEDAAESLGAVYRGRASGTIGAFGIYSFNGNKIITTSGGGMLVSDDTAALQRARFWATQARDAAPYYQHSELGYNYRLSNVLAGIGRGQLHVLSDRVDARRRVFARYERELSDADGIAFHAEMPYGRTNRWLTALTVDPALGITPDDIIRRMSEQGIETRRLWKPMHLQPLFNHCPFYAHDEARPVADRLFEQGLCLPSGSALSEEEQGRVIDCLRGCIADAAAVPHRGGAGTK